MAKAKTTCSPNKGKAMGKAKASATPDPPLRRSPRKAAVSTKKAEAEEAAKVTKKASPAKTTSTVKKLASALKKPAAAKAAKAAAKSETAKSTETASAALKKAAATKSKSPAVKTTATPAVKETGKAATPTPKPAAAKKDKSPTKSATASPRPSGRPKKNAEPTTASPRPRGRPPKHPAASPAKVTRAKARPKKAKTSKWEGLKTQVGKRPSKALYFPDWEGTTDDGSASEGKGDMLVAGAPVMQSSTQARSKSPAKVRMNSAPSRLESPASGTKARSRCGSTAGSRAPSKSPAKTTPVARKKSAISTRSRSQSPAKAVQATTSRRASSAGARGRSQSPAKRRTSSTATRTRSKSPAKVTKPSSPRKTAGATSRVRSQSPVKDAGAGRRGHWLSMSGLVDPQLMPADMAEKMVQIQQAAAHLQQHAALMVQDVPPEDVHIGQSVEVNPRTGQKWDVTTTRRKQKAPVRTPGGGRPYAEATSEGREKRPRELPPKIGQPPRSKSQSPTKSSARSPTKASASRPPPSSPKSPQKAPLRSPTESAPRRTSADAHWDARFTAPGAYGKTLRALETKAHAAQKGGRAFRGVSPYVKEEDGERARRQGVERAKAEFALRALAAGKEQRVREGYEGRVVDLDGEEGEGEARGKSKSPTRQLKPSSARRKSSASSQKSSPRKSPRPGPSSSTSKSASRGNGSRRKLSTTAADDDDDDELSNPLATGQLSAPDRGTVHSVTNPETIAGTTKKNPFFETMPGPEAWHREQPPYFMFGETPFMQREISRQINEDLRKGAGGGTATSCERETPRSNSISGTFTSLFSFGKAKEQRLASLEQPKARQSPFALPLVEDEQVEAMLRDLGLHGGKRRNSHGSSSPGRSAKRPRRMSGGNGSRSRSPPAYRMSGAL